MPDDALPPKLRSGFWGLDTGKAQQLYRPHTLMRTTEWGGLTLVTLLSAFLFPPYFVAVLGLAFLNAGGLLWVTHLSEKGRQRLLQFEAEFRKGFEQEQAGQYEKAAALYSSLVPRFQDFPKIAEIASHRVKYLQTEHPEAFAPAKAPRRSGSGRGRRR